MSQTKSWRPYRFLADPATCATCQVVVVEGSELLKPADDEEQDLLNVLGSPPEGASGMPGGCFAQAREPCA